MKSSAHTIHTHLTNGRLSGDSVVTTTKTIGDLTGYWSDARAFAQMDSATLLYTTESWLPVGEETEGALAWGNTTLYPGKVGDEYFMTRGHWHRKRHLGELVICVAGEGALILMDEERRTRIELLAPNSTHYVPGNTAHRTVNTGAVPLVFLCAWTANCGHDYEDIRERGFSRIVIEVNGTLALVAHETG